MDKCINIKKKNLLKNLFQKIKINVKNVYLVKYSY